MSQGFAGNGNMKIGGHRQGRKGENELRPKKTLERRYRPTSKQVTFSFRLEPPGKEESRKMEKRKPDPPKTVLWIGDEEPDELDEEQLDKFAGCNWQSKRLSVGRHRFHAQLLEAIEDNHDDFDLIAVEVEDNGFLRILNKLVFLLFGEGLSCYFFVNEHGRLRKICQVSGLHPQVWDPYRNPDVEVDYGTEELPSGKISRFPVFSLIEYTQPDLSVPGLVNY